MESTLAYGTMKRAKPSRKNDESSSRGERKHRAERFLFELRKEPLLEEPRLSKRPQSNSLTKSRWWLLMVQHRIATVKRRKQRSPRFVLQRGRRSSRPNNPSPNVCWPRRQRCQPLRGRESYCSATHTSMVPGKTGSKTARKRGKVVGELSTRGGEEVPCRKIHPQLYQHSGKCSEGQLTGGEISSDDGKRRNRSERGCPE